MNKFPEEVQVSLGRLLDGEQEPEDAKLVVAWLHENPNFRASVYDLFCMDGMLQINADFDASAFVASVETRIDSKANSGAFVSELEAVIDHGATFESPQPVIRSGTWLPWLIAVAASIALILQIVTSKNNPTIGSVDSLPPAQVPVDRVVESSLDVGLVALLVNQANADFGDGRSVEDVRFGVGRYQLTSGGIHLRFVNGVDMVARAPAEFEIESDMSVLLLDGSLRSMVPQVASGFTIHVEGAQFEDVGTEFGVQMNRETQESQLHVFSGKVRVRTSLDQTPKLHVTGESVRVIDGRIEPAPGPQADLYPTPADLNFMRWEQFRDGLVDDRGLIGYYPFQDLGSDSLRNVASDPVIVPGRITGARWVTGRWPGKSALLFDQVGDRVSLALPDAYEQLSLSIWLNPDRVDYAHTSLISSDGASQGAVHWKIDQSGRTYFAAAGEGWRGAFGPVVRFGRWSHLVVVVDLSAKTIRQYINGKRVNTAKMDIPFIKLGSCRMGDWLPEEGHPEITRKRGFVGRMGELAVWNRPLSDDDVKRIWEGTRPSFHQFD